jgi:tetratricopeptide (TPR) repeat protein
LERALTIDEKGAGEHSKMAIRFNNLARLYQKTNQPAEAEPLLWQALTIDGKSFGSDHLKVAIRLSNLALFYYNQGEYAKAEPLYRRALAIREKALGPEDPDVARAGDSGGSAGLRLIERRR